MQRQDGYYWVKVKQRRPWEIAALDDGKHWYVTGSSRHYKAESLFEIGPKIEPPKEERRKLTIEDIEKAAKSLDLQVERGETAKQILYAQQILPLNDNLFKGYYQCGWLEIHGSTDQIKEIEERAIKLGLK